MDKLPKRRKSKDNPYTILIEDNKYYILFKDNKGYAHKEKVDEEVYLAFDSFELEDISQMHKYERHIEHSEVYEEKLYLRLENKLNNDILYFIIQKDINERLYKSLNTLTEIQKRIIILYYFFNKTLKEISEIDNCSIHSIHVSIDSSLKKLKKFLIDM